MPRPSTRATLHGGALALATLAALAVAGTPARAQTAPAAAPPTGRPVTLTGVAWDSLSRAPMVGAIVQLASETNPGAPARTATADSTGRWRLDSVPQGIYLAGYFHPTLDELGIEPPTFRVQVQADSVATLDLGLPGPARMHALLCGAPAADDSTGGIVGLLRDADSDEAVGGATLSVAWRELVIEKGSIRNVQRRIPVLARGGGLFLACGVPTDTPVELDAAAPRRSSGVVELQVPRHQLVRLDVLMGDSALAVGAPIRATADSAAASAGVRVADGARLRGTVKGPDGKPLARARVDVSGIGRSATTGPTGAFQLDSLPTGTFGLDVRALGFAPVRVSVDLTRRRPASVAVALTDRAIALSTVVVRGRRSRQSTFLEEFAERRRRAAGGTFLGPAELERRTSLYVSDALRTVAGMRVQPGRGFGQVLRGRGGCAPGVFIDGMQIVNGADDVDQLVNPASVMAMEIYSGLGAIPPQFSGLSANGCGAVVIWTKR